MVPHRPTNKLDSRHLPYSSSVNIRPSNDGQGTATIYERQLAVQIARKLCIRSVFVCNCVYRHRPCCCDRDPMAKTHPAEKLRATALRLPEVEEGSSCNKSAFKARKKAFLYLGVKDESYNLMLKIGPSQSEGEKLAKRERGGSILSLPIYRNVFCKRNHTSWHPYGQASTTTYPMPILATIPTAELSRMCLWWTTTTFMGQM